MGAKAVLILCVVGAAQSTARAAIISSDTSNPHSIMGSLGIGTTLPGVSLDVAGGVRAGSSAVVTACSGTTEGAQRYNYTTHAMEYCTGTAWVQVLAQAAGANTPVVASGPPVGANIYAYSATADYTPGYGAIANINNGIWPASGASGVSNASCVSIYDVNTTPAQTITIDLGSVKAVNKLYVSMEGNHTLVTLGITFSLDNVTYANSTTYYHEDSDYTRVYYSTVAFSPGTSARYLRITNVGNNAGYSSYETLCQLAVGP